MIVVAPRALPLGFTYVPGEHGSTALLLLLGAAVAGGLAALQVRRRSGWSPGTVVAAALVFGVGLLALSRLPNSVHVREKEYRADRGLSYLRAEGQVQAGWGIDPQFISLLAREIPKHGRFYIVAGPSITTSGPHSWAQYELMPRVEEYYTPCRAGWIVLVAARNVGRTAGLRLGAPIVSYKPGYAVGRNLDRCTR